MYGTAGTKNVKNRLKNATKDGICAIQIIVFNCSIIWLEFRLVMNYNNDLDIDMVAY